MAIYYLYNSTEYANESDAQNAVTVLVDRLANNPSDWMVVKEIIGSESAGWSLSSTTLSDAEILNPDTSKIYMAYSLNNGINIMPLTSDELVEKRNEFRSVYTQSIPHINEIKKYDDSTEPPTVTAIPTTTDMSGYL